MTAAALSVPAIAVSMATPARAASAGGSLALNWANGDADRLWGADLSDATATILSSTGQPVPGETVQFSASIASFPGGGNTYTGTTDSAGKVRAAGLVADATPQEPHTASVAARSSFGDGIIYMNLVSPVLSNADAAVTSVPGFSGFPSYADWANTGLPGYKRGIWTRPVDYLNNGPESIPAGSTIRLAATRTAFTTLSISGFGQNATALGMNGSTVVAGGRGQVGTLDYQDYVVNVAIPPGSSFRLVWSCVVPERTSALLFDTYSEFTSGAISDPNTSNNLRRPATQAYVVPSTPAPPTGGNFILYHPVDKAYLAINEAGGIAGHYGTVAEARQTAATVTFPAQGATGEIYTASGLYLHAYRTAGHVPWVVTRPRDGTQNQQFTMRGDGGINWAWGSEGPLLAQNWTELSCGNQAPMLTLVRV